MVMGTVDTGLGTVDSTMGTVDLTMGTVDSTMGTVDSGFGSYARAGRFTGIEEQQERVIGDVRLSNESTVYQVYISAVRLSLCFNYSCYFYVGVIFSLVLTLSIVCCHSCIFDVLNIIVIDRQINF